MVFVYVMKQRKQLEDSLIINFYVLLPCVKNHLIVAWVEFPLNHFQWTASNPGLPIFRKTRRCF